MGYMSFETFDRLVKETKFLLRDLEDISKILNRGVITSETLGDELIDAILNMLDEHFEVKDNGDNVDLVLDYITDETMLTPKEIYDMLVENNCKQEGNNESI